MGENVHGQVCAVICVLCTGVFTLLQEILILAEYLRLKQFSHMQASKCLRQDFPDLRLPTGPEVVAGMLYVPLSRNGKDFIVLLRQGQLRHVHWAGKPTKGQNQHGVTLEPRKSFRMWSETIEGKSRAWTDEQLETAAVLALVYGKVCASFTLGDLLLTPFSLSSSRSGDRRRPRFKLHS